MRAYYIFLNIGELLVRPCHGIKDFVESPIPVKIIGNVIVQRNQTLILLDAYTKIGLKS